MRLGSTFAVSDHIMGTTLDIVYSVLFSAVLVWNIAGNSLVIYIITNEQGMKTSTNYLLLNLAVADLLFGIFFAPEFIVTPLLAKPFLPDGVLGDWLCKLVFYGNIGSLASKASIFTMLCLSVERYFAVCRPHTFKQRFSPKIVKALVVVSWLYAALMASPYFVFAHFSREYLNCSFGLSKFMIGHSLLLLIESTFSIALMLFLLAKICISLWCKQTLEPTGEREITERKKRKKVTLCVVAVVVTFVLCWTPTYVNYIILVGFDPTPSMTGSSLAACVNAALDPYLFSFQSSRFKFLIKKIICCKKESLR